MTAHNTGEFGRLAAIFDRGFCVNVLSVIPFHAVRERALNLIRAKLRAGGTCLFVVQYRNSDFTRMSQMKNAKRWQDGYLINSRRGYSFYGLISPASLRVLVSGAGFEIIDCRINDGSAYLTARSPKLVKLPRSFDIDETNNFRIRHQSASK